MDVAAGAMAFSTNPFAAFAAAETKLIEALSSVRTMRAAICC